MTSIGLKILDIFFEVLRDKSPKKKKILSDKDVYILSQLYNWEESSKTIKHDIAAELKISEERVRQIAVRALRKVKRIVYPEFDPVNKIRAIIDCYATPDEKRQPYKTIVRLCFWEMNGLVTIKMIRLLSYICLNKKKEIVSAIQYYKSQKEILVQEFKAQRILERRKYQRITRFNEFLASYVIWFNKVSNWDKDHFHGKEPKRIIIEDPRYQSGIFYSSKTNRNVQYESSAELSFIQQLESSPKVIYYLEQPITIEYERNDRLRSYTPDFAVLLNDGRCFIAEIKANFRDILDTRVHRKIEVLIEFCQQHGFGILIANGLYSFDYLANYPINVILEKVLQDKLNERGGRTIFLNEFKEILKQYGVNGMEVLALILKNNWGYYPFPFKLTPQNPYILFRQEIINKLIQKE